MKDEKTSYIFWGVYIEIDWWEKVYITKRRDIKTKYYIEIRLNERPCMQ